MLVVIELSKVIDGGLDPIQTAIYRIIRLEKLHTIRRGHTDRMHLYFPGVRTSNLKSV